MRDKPFRDERYAVSLPATTYYFTSIVLHGAAMQGAVLTDDGATVDAHNLAVREGLANDSYCLCVEVGLGVSGYEYGTIDDQIVGVGGRKTVMTLPRPLQGGGEASPWGGLEGVIYRAGKGQLQETIGLTL